MIVKLPDGWHRLTPTLQIKAERGIIAKALIHDEHGFHKLVWPLPDSDPPAVPELEAPLWRGSHD